MSTWIGLIHLFAAAVWIGGMIYMNIVLMPSLAAIDPPQRGRLVGAVAKKFTIVSWLSVVALASTGLLRTPGPLLFDTASPYGRLLTVKLLLFGVMIAIGAVITFGFAPKLHRFAPKPGEPPAREFLAAQRGVKLLSGTNTLLGVTVLVLVTVLRA